MSSSPRVEVRFTAARGRALFASQAAPRGTLLQQDPVVLVKLGEVQDGAPISDYLIRWDDAHDCVALGPCSFLNHADEPRCAVEIDPESLSVKLVALTDIAAGDELTIRYRCALWFTPTSG